MLKPIKNFLTYLQRNANSSNIFGLTTAPAATTMGPTGAVEEPVARLGETVVLEADELVIEDRDPLCDPLALDDECQNEPELPPQDHSANDSGQPDEDTAAAGEIIIVDVSTLKSRIALENGENSDRLETDQEQTVQPSTADQCLLPEEHNSESDGSIYVLPFSDLSSNAESLDRSRDEGSTTAVAASTTMVTTVATESARVEESITITIDSSIDSVVEIHPDTSDECVDPHPSLTVAQTESFTTIESSMEIEEEEEEEVIDATEILLEKVVPNIQHDPMDGDQHPRTGEGAEVVQANVPKAGAAECVNSEVGKTVDRDGGVVVQEGTTVVDLLPATSAGEEEEASDGSDSGLGLEPVSSSHPIAVLDVDLLPPIKSSLKRRSEPTDTEEQGAGIGTASREEKDEGATSQKRAKKGICFDGVTVYYFPRMQGFGCVPSQGGCTLGMESQHVHSRRLTLAEHAAEQRKVHRQQLQELNQRSSSSEDSSSDEEPSESGSEAESESYGFLQPVSARQRRALLKAAGVRRIDPSEKDECREIRTSREVCGCTCRGFCNPNTCACSLAGIKCQVDRPSFPCGCTHESCHNTAGRVEFNPNRVRSHFMHTIMRLSLEDKANEMRQTMQQQQTASSRPSPSLTNGACATVANGSGTVSKLLLTTDAAPNSNSSSGGYLGSTSEKNWSSGPVRLPPSTMTIYDGTAGAVADGLHASEHAHALQQHSQHQQQLQLHAQQHHVHHPQPTMPYPSGTAAGMAHIDPSAHMVPLQSSYHQHPLTHHLSSGQGPTSYQDYYRDYYIGTMAMGMSHLTPTPPPLHFYGSYVGPGHASIDPYQAHQQPVHHHQLHQQQQQHVVATMAIGQQPMAINDNEALLHHQPLHHGNMLSTGHDRHAASYASNGTDHTLQSNSNEVSVHANVTSPAASSSEGPPPDTASIVHIDCDSYEVSLVHEDEDLKSTTLISTPDSCATENGPPERSTQSVDGSSVSVSPVKNPSDTTFFDLTTPNAGNAERLEVINGMLESTRHTVSMAQRASLTMTVAAEDDSELRDFCHSPTLPLQSVSDAPVESTKPWDQTEHHLSSDEHESCPEPPLDVPNGTNEQHENGNQQLNDDVAAEEYLNGSGLTTVEDVQPGINEEATYQHSNNSTDGTSVVAEASSILAETKATEPSVKSSPVVTVSPDEIATVQETDTVANDGEDTAEVAVDPNENLSEIIKNSIVETAVLH